MENPMKYNLATRSREPFILRNIKPNKNEKVLDIGCGLGYFSAKLRKNTPFVYGFDIDFDSLRYAKKDAYCIVGDALNLPFKDGTFDYILASEVIEHLNDDGKFLSEIKRVAKKNALFVVTTNSTEGIFPITRNCHEKGPEFHYKDGYSDKEIISMFKDRRLKILKKEYTISFFSKLFMEIVKLFFKAKYRDFEKQSDVFKSTDSSVFKIYKFFFPFFLILNWLDRPLSKLIKGNDILVLAKNEN